MQTSAPTTPQRRPAFLEPNIKLTRRQVMMERLAGYASHLDFDPEVYVVDPAVVDLAARFAQAAIGHAINPGGEPN